MVGAPHAPLAPGRGWGASDAPPPPTAGSAARIEVVTFSADRVTYDSNADVVTASGDVRMHRDGNYLAADQVVWDRKSGQVYAKGNVVAC